VRLDRLDGANRHPAIRAVEHDVRLARPHRLRRAFENFNLEQVVVDFADRDLPHRTAGLRSIRATERRANAERQEQLPQALRNLAIRLIDAVEPKFLVVAAFAVVEPADEGSALVVVESEDPVRNPELLGNATESLREEACCANRRVAQGPPVPAVVLVLPRLEVECVLDRRSNEFTYVV